MKQMKLSTKTIISASIAFIAIGGIYALNSQHAPQTKPNLINYVEGFEKETLITVTSLSKENITENKIDVLGKEKTHLPFSQDNAPGKFLLNVKNQTQSFDITATQTIENIILKFEGLALDTKISVLVGKKQIHQNIPVDWAGHLTLKQKNTTSTLCAVINNKEKICYSQSKGSPA